MCYTSTKYLSYVKSYNLKLFLNADILNKETAELQYITIYKIHTSFKLWENKIWNTQLIRVSPTPLTKHVSVEVCINGMISVIINWSKLAQPSNLFIAISLWTFTNIVTTVFFVDITFCRNMLHPTVSAPNKPVMLTAPISD